MTDTGTARGGLTMVRLFAASMVVGVVLGFATSFVFLLIIGVPLLGILIGGAGLRGEARDPSYTAAGAGLLGETGASTWRFRTEAPGSLVAARRSVGETAPFPC